MQRGSLGKHMCTKINGNKTKKVSCLDRKKRRKDQSVRRDNERFREGFNKKGRQRRVILTA